MRGDRRAERSTEERNRHGSHVGVKQQLSGSSVKKFPGNFRSSGWSRYRDGDVKYAYSCDRDGDGGNYGMNNDDDRVRTGARGACTLLYAAAAAVVDGGGARRTRDNVVEV